MQISTKFDIGQEVWLIDRPFPAEVIDIVPLSRIDNFEPTVNIVYRLKGVFGLHNESDLFSSHAAAMKAQEGKG